MFYFLLIYWQVFLAINLRDLLTGWEFFIFPPWVVAGIFISRRCLGEYVEVAVAKKTQEDEWLWKNRIDRSISSEISLSNNGRQRWGTTNVLLLPLLSCSVGMWNSYDSLFFWRSSHKLRVSHRKSAAVSERKRKINILLPETNDH